MLSFLITEREQAGWRFLLLWLIASNIGFSIGLGLEILIFKQITLYIAVPLAAVGQAYIINRHISIYLPWAVGTAIFWIIGLAIASPLIKIMMTPEDLMQQLIFLAVVAAIAGLFAAIPQWFFMRDWLPKMGIWWFALSALGWAVFVLPGLITGLILMRQITEQKINMDERHYNLSGNY